MSNQQEEKQHLIIKYEIWRKKREKNEENQPKKH